MRELYEQIGDGYRRFDPVVVDRSDLTRALLELKHCVSRYEVNRPGWPWIWGYDWDRSFARLAGAVDQEWPRRTR